MRRPSIESLLHLISAIFAVLVLFAVLPLCSPPLAAQSKVQVIESGLQYQLLIDDQRFFIDGASGTSHLKDLRKLGGNSLRVDVRDLEQMIETEPLIDLANELGLKVTATLRLQQQSADFDYGNPVQVQAQRDAVRQAVHNEKNKPALIIWALDAGQGTNDARIRREIDAMVDVIKQEDPNHPVMAVISGTDLAHDMATDCPDVDILGIDAFGAISGLGNTLLDAGWKGPFILTQFGAPDDKSAPKTTWGAPVEPSANEKAISYFVSEKAATDDGKRACLGTYAFLWGSRPDPTPTWFGMFLSSGEKLPQADVMCMAWTGHWPDKRCPVIWNLSSSVTQLTVPAGSAQKALVDATDWAKLPLEFKWQVIEESPQPKTLDLGDDAVPGDHPECISGDPSKSLDFTAPNTPGAYRLYVTVRNGTGSAATANIPFRVEQPPPN